MAGGGSYDEEMAQEKVKPRLKLPKPKFFFREWRKHRGLTQEDLADAIGMTPASISQLETGKQGFSDVTLVGLADALACQPGDLLMRNPLDTEAVWSIWDNIPADRRDQAVKVLKTFADEPKKTGTTG